MSFSSFRTAYNQGRLTFFFFSLSKGLDNSQSFLGYVLLTKLFLLFSITCTGAQFIIGGIMMNRRQW